MKIAFAVLALAAAVPGLAASPFDGTWKIDLATANLSKKPSVTVLKDGVYTCSSCVPVLTVRADGAFHKVSGFNYFDELSIKVVDASTTVEVDKLKGKVIGGERTVVAADGTTKRVAWTDDSAPDGKQVTGEMVLTRTAAAPAGAHAISGTWLQTSVGKMSDAATTLSYVVTDAGVTLTTPNGYKIDAKFGGPAAPVVGDLAGTTAMFKRIDATTIEETDTTAGEVVAVFTTTAQPDGKMLKMVSENRKSGSTSSYTLIKQ